MNSPFGTRLLTILFIMPLLCLVSGFPAAAAGPAPPGDDYLLGEILRFHPHRIDRGASLFHREQPRPGLARGVWNPTESGLTGFPTSDRYATEIMASKRVETAGRTVLYVATASNDLAETNSCHACAPVIGFALFEHDQNGWRLAKNILNMELQGSWGEPPSMDFVPIGPSRWGLAMEPGYTGMGQTGVHYVLYDVSVGRPVEILDVEQYFDASAAVGGMLEEYTGKDAKVVYLPCNACEYYDIEVRADLTDYRLGPGGDAFDVVGRRREVQQYRFAGDKYQLMGAK